MDNPNQPPIDNWTSRNCDYDEDTTKYSLLAKLFFHVIPLRYFNRRAIDEDYTEEDSKLDELKNDMDVEEVDYDWMEMTRICDICHNQVQDEDDEPVFECPRCSSAVCLYCERERGQVREAQLEGMLVCTICWTPADNAIVGDKNLDACTL